MTQIIEILEIIALTVNIALTVILAERFLRTDTRTPIKKRLKTPLIKPNFQVDEAFLTQLENIDNYGTDKPQKEIKA